MLNLYMKPAFKSVKLSGMNLKLTLMGVIVFFFLNGPFAKAQQMNSAADSVARQNQAVSFPLTLDSTQSPMEAFKQKLSPVTKGAVYMVAGAGVWAATYVWVDEPLQKFSQRHRSDFTNKVSEYLDPLGRQKYWGPVTGAVAVGGILLKDPKLQKAGMVALGSLFLSGGFTTFLKNSTHRHRPDRTTQNDLFDWRSPESIHTSLPSAHTTVAFVIATTASTVYGDEHKFVGPFAYGMATLIGLSRIHDNAHWATDVLAGAANGYLSVKGTNLVYDYLSEKLRLRKQRVMIVPVGALEAGAVNVSLVF